LHRAALAIHASAWSGSFDEPDGIRLGVIQGSLSTQAPDNLRLLAARHSRARLAAAGRPDEPDHALARTPKSAPRSVSNPCG